MPTRKKRNHAIVGVFETKARADRAVAELKAAGFDDDDIGMIHRDREGKTVKSGAADDTYAEEGAAAGAIAGAAGGALVGAGIIAGVIPVLGPVLALGTLGTILVNAAGGAAIAGLAGALIGWGIPEEDAEYYESEVKAGRFLVTVNAHDREDEARSILRGQGGFDRTGWEAVRADRANTMSEGGFRDESGRVIQLREEHLRADKERVDTGEVKVRKEVHTEHKQMTVPVEREEVVVERRPARPAGLGRHEVGGDPDPDAGGTRAGDEGTGGSRGGVDRQAEGPRHQERERRCPQGRDRDRVAGRRQGAPLEPGREEGSSQA